MIQFFVTHWKIAMPIAVAMLNIIAISAILVARFEIRKASSEIAKLRLSRPSASAVSLAATKERAN